MPKLAILGGGQVKTISAKDAKNNFGMLIDTARAEPVIIEKHGRPVVVVLSTEAYERLLIGAGRSKEGAARRDGEQEGA